MVVKTVVLLSAYIVPYLLILIFASCWMKVICTVPLLMLFIFKFFTSLCY